MIKQNILKILVNVFIWLCEILEKQTIDLNKLVGDLRILENKTIKTMDLLAYLKKDDTKKKEAKNGNK